METPKSARNIRPTRHPTPRLSERKKSLFLDGEQKVAGNDILEGIKLLEPSDYTTGNNSIVNRSRCSIESLLKANSRTSTVSFLNDVPEVCATPLRRSPRTKSKAKYSQNSLFKPISGKENTLNVKDVEDVADEQLHKIFNISMRISSYNQSPKRCDAKKVEVQKRHQDDEENAGLSPLKKTRKYILNEDDLSAISTKRFYSVSRPSKLHSEVQKSCTAKMNYPSTSSGNVNVSPRSRVRINRRISGKVNIYKGVKHKIRRPARSNGTRGCDIRNTLSSIDIDLILKNVRNEKLKNLIASKREQRQNIEKIHDIFRRCPNPIEMARPLTVISGIDDSNNNSKDTNFAVGKINSDIVDEADIDFSDIDSNLDEYEEISNAEEIIPLISHQPAAIEAAITESECETRQAITPTKRKFFKSGRSYNTPKEVRITDNIKASICNGKLSLIQEEKKIRRKPKRRSSTTYDITDEQATVETILKNLDDTAYGDIVVENVQQKSEEINGNHSMESSIIQFSSDFNYSLFRNRLPYNTTDTTVIEQQHILLDFLINNNMCTEENFTIFIADPDNHKEEAARIVDQVFVLVNEQDYFRQRIPYNTNYPEIESQQHRMLDFLITNNICTEENFDIFIANYNQRHKEADDIMSAIQNQNKSISPPSGFQNVISDAPKSHNENNEFISTINNFENAHLVEKTATESIQSSSDKTPTPLSVHESTDDSKEKLFPIFYTHQWKPLQQQSKRNIPQSWNMGRGANQYQIDAGQRNFGAHQCKQCGLVYSIHEPEEEKLHRNYHASLNLLRFKGWIDEDIVAIYPEWGADGRILRITDTSHTRRHERLTDILTIVDKELGFASSYLIPQTFVAYLAVRKFQIVGLCLVVPLEKANKYISVDGVDCCTEEEYPAMCGISRIWVAPLHRRLHIASKLIHAVQQNTVFGEEIPADKIAFSAPTETGRMFAQKVTQLEDFLVYQ